MCWLLACAAVPCFSVTALGQTFNWVGNGSNSNWNYSLAGFYQNWSPGSLPPSTADVVFGTGFGSGNPHTNGSRTVRHLTINTGTGFSLTGNPGDLLMITGSLSRTAASSGTQTIAVATQHSGAITVEGSGALVLGAALSGGGLAKDGAGTLILGGGTGDTAANTYTASTIVNAGALVLNKATGTNAIPGELILQASGDVYLRRSQQINDQNLITFNSGNSMLHLGSPTEIVNETVAGLRGVGLGTLALHLGSLTLLQDGSHQFNGSITSSGTSAALLKQGAGTLRLTNSVDIGRLHVGGGTVALAGGVHRFRGTGVSSLSGMYLTGNARITISDGADVQATTRAQLDSGMLHISGGTTRFQTFELMVGYPSSATALIDTGGTATIALAIVGAFDGSSLSVQSGALLAGSSVLVGPFTGTAGTINIDGSNSRLTANTLRLGGDVSPAANARGIVNVTSNGSVIVNGLTSVHTADSLLNINGGSFTTNRLIGSQGGAIQISDPASGGTALTINMPSQVSDTFNGAIRDAASGSGSIRKSGAGSMTFSGPLTYTGTTQIDAGTLNLINPVMSTGGTIIISGPGVLRASGTIPRPLTGGGLILPTGNLNIGDSSSTSGINYGGTVLLSGHTLGLLDADQAVISGTISLQGGRLSSFFGTTLTSTGRINGPGTIANNFTNQGTVLGADGLILTGVVNGTGSFLGNVTFSGLYSPGNSPASVTLGNPTFANTLRIELGGTTPGSQHDHLNITGAATFGGTLAVRLIDGFVSLPGQQFDIINFASRSGDFAVANETGYAGLGFSKIYTPTSLSLLATGTGGDANLDGAVNLSDFNILASNFGTSGANWLMADFNGDGLVNLADFNILASNFGVVASGTDVPTPGDWSNLASAVPEPTTSLTVALSALALAQRRRRT